MSLLLRHPFSLMDPLLSLQRTSLQGRGLPVALDFSFLPLSLPPTFFLYSYPVGTMQPPFKIRGKHFLQNLDIQNKADATMKRKIFQ